MDTAAAASKHCTAIYPEWTHRHVQLHLTVTLFLSRAAISRTAANLYLITDPHMKMLCAKQGQGKDLGRCLKKIRFFFFFKQVYKITACRAANVVKLVFRLN